MSRRRVIIDCDPGLDDGINLLLAFASSDELDILGITTVAGNVQVDFTTRNALMICELAGATQIPVFPGSAAPLRKALMTAEKVHGPTGFGDLHDVPTSTRAQTTGAVDFLNDTLRKAARGTVTLVATGPLTNIATAIEQAPDGLEAIAEIVLMGGARTECGNCAPSAEFNLYVDPDAAAIVLGCGRPVVMHGLDVTHQLPATKNRRDSIRNIRGDVGKFAAGMLDYLNRHDPLPVNPDGAPLHDPTTIAYLLAPDLFAGVYCNVTVETQSELTLGHTAVDFWGVTTRAPNAMWINQVNADRFYELLIERLRRYSA